MRLAYRPRSWFLFSIFFIFLIFKESDGRGLSKKIPENSKSGGGQSRYLDYLGEQRVPCEMPPITPKLPTRIRAKIEQIWLKVEKNGDCWIEMAQTRNALLRLTNSEKWIILRREAKECSDFKMEKLEFLEKNAAERMRNDKECWDRQRSARTLLLNLPGTYKHNPPAFECALPHFYNRLESSLQEKLAQIWSTYTIGSCVEQIDKQIQLLEENDISLKSFQMPPPSMFRKREIRRKLRRRVAVA